VWGCAVEAWPAFATGRVFEKASLNPGRKCRKVKKGELARFYAAVTDWERGEYLEAF
jgi:hypothetical protein